MAAGIGFLAATDPSLAQRPLRVEVRANVLPNQGFSSASFSPEGKYVLVGDPIGGTQLWDAATGRLIRNFKAGKTVARRYVNSTAMSLRSRLIAGVDRDGVISVWDAATGRLVRTIEGPAGQANIAFAADGRQLLALGQDEKIRLWDTTTWRLARTFDAKDTQGLTEFVLSPDGRFMAVILKDETAVRVFDIATGRAIATLAGHTSVNAIAFSADARRIATGSGKNPGDGKLVALDPTVRVWDLPTGQLKQILQGHAAPARTVAFSADQSRVVSLSEDGAIKTWDAQTGDLTASVTAPVGDRGEWRLSPDAMSVLVQTKGEALEILNVSTGKVVHKLGAELESITTTQIAAARNQLLVGGMLPAGDQNHDARVWNLTTGQLTSSWKFEGAVAPPTAVVFSPDGTLAASGNSVAEGQEGTIRIWDVANARVIRKLEGRPKTAGLAFSVDGARIAAAEADGTLTVWDVTTGVELWHIDLPEDVGRPDDVWLAFALQTNQLIHGSGIHVLVIDAATGRIRRTIQHREDYSISSIALSPDGRRVIVADRAWDTNVKIWDTQTGRRVFTLKGHEDAAWAVAYSPNGKLVVSGGADGTARIFDAATGALRHVLSTDSGNLVRTIAFSRNSARVFLGYADGAIRIWDAANGVLVATLFAGLSGEWIAITPEGFFDVDPSVRGTELIHAVRGLDVIGIGQLFQSLYRPALVRQRLAGDPQGLVKAAAARLDLDKVIASGTAPAVAILAPKEGERASDGIAAEIAITAADGGIGRLEWRVNGVTVAVDERPGGAEGVASGQTLKLRRTLGLDEGQNTIEVVAYNRANLVASTRASSTATAAPTAAAKPRLFVLAAGINTYADRRLNLSNPVNDTDALGKILQQAGKENYEQVAVTKLNNEQVTRDRLEVAFADLASRMRPTDVFVFFLAGHGLTENGRYYFIPHDFAPNAPIAKSGISQDQFQVWLARVPAKRSILLFDTCQSGTLAGDPSETREQEDAAAHGRLVQATGRTILTASAENEDALESFEAHGLFTYSLVHALMWSDGDANGSVEVAELAAYVYAHVASLSQSTLKRRQLPQILIRGPNFSLAHVLPAADRTPSRLVIPSKTTHRLSATTDLSVLPRLGSARVRTLLEGTTVTLLSNDFGWALVAKDGQPVGYVPPSALAPIP